MISQQCILRILVSHSTKYNAKGNGKTVEFHVIKIIIQDLVGWRSFKEIVNSSKLIGIWNRLRRKCPPSGASCDFIAINAVEAHLCGEWARLAVRSISVYLLPYKSALEPVAWWHRTEFNRQCLFALVRLVILVVRRAPRPAHCLCDKWQWRDYHHWGMRQSGWYTRHCGVHGSGERAGCVPVAMV